MRFCNRTRVIVREQRGVKTYVACLWETESNGHIVHTRRLFSFFRKHGRIAYCILTRDPQCSQSVFGCFLSCTTDPVCSTGFWEADSNTNDCPISWGSSLKKQWNEATDTARNWWFWLFQQVWKHSPRIFFSFFFAACSTELWNPNYLDFLEIHRFLDDFVVIGQFSFGRQLHEGFTQNALVAAKNKRLISLVYKYSCRANTVPNTRKFPPFCALFVRNHQNFPVVLCTEPVGILWQQYFYVWEHIRQRLWRAKDRSAGKFSLFQEATWRAEREASRTGTCLCSWWRRAEVCSSSWWVWAGSEPSSPLEGGPVSCAACLKRSTMFTKRLRLFSFLYNWPSVLNRILRRIQTRWDKRRPLKLA